MTKNEFTALVNKLREEEVQFIIMASVEDEDNAAGYASNLRDVDGQAMIIHLYKILTERIVQSPELMMTIMLASKLGNKDSEDKED